jgi:hypothetical protein
MNRPSINAARALGCAALALMLVPTTALAQEMTH